MILASDFGLIRFECQTIVNKKQADHKHMNLCLCKTNGHPSLVRERRSDPYACPFLLLHISVES